MKRIFEWLNKENLEFELFKLEESYKDYLKKTKKTKLLTIKKFRISIQV